MLQAGYLFGGEFLSSGMASPCMQVESLLMNRCVCFFSMDGSRMWFPMECVGYLCMILLAAFFPSKEEKKYDFCLLYSQSGSPLLCRSPQKKIKMLFLYILLSTSCSTKKKIHQSIPKPCTRQLSINFHLERLDARHSHATVHHYLQTT